MERNNRILLTICIPLIIILSLSAVGCNSENPKNPETIKSGEANIKDSADSDSGLQAAQEGGPELPDMDFGGEEIKFLVKEEGGGITRWTSVEVYAEEQNGELINDAVYMRNIAIEEKYNTKITREYSPAGGANSFDMFRKINTLVLAADDTYDIVMPTLEDSARMAQEGIYQNLNALPHIDLSKPWWNQKILETTALNNKAFFATGDISLLSMQATYTMLFNKAAHQMLEFEDMYQIVRGGKWTIDKLIEMSRSCAADLNSDGVINDLDRSGLVCIHNLCRSLYAASGEKLVDISPNGEFELTVKNPRSIDVLDKIYELFEERGKSIFITSDEKIRSAAVKGMDHVNLGAQVFAGGGALFLMGTMQNVPYMREMETDFGILPLPKYDEKQKDYNSFVHTWAASSCGILITAKNPERSAVILEEMAYQSMKSVTPVYYDLSLKTKFARDEESAEMLDVIFQNRVCDLGYLYNIGGFVTGLEDLVYVKRQNNFVSFIEANEGKAQGELDNIIESYAKIN
ncbi:MAG: hypothetical protein FWD23_07960 [Oscillospiraceae bacterium]|nr:hypothetical protein [Oscillospiraceae bacterium]